MTVKYASTIMSQLKIHIPLHNFRRRSVRGGGEREGGGRWDFSLAAKRVPKIADRWGRPLNSTHGWLSMESTPVHHGRRDGHAGSTKTHSSSQQHGECCPASGCFLINRLDKIFIHNFIVNKH